MKPECEKCPLKDKSKQACIKRQCEHADMPPPSPTETRISKWPITVCDAIGDDQIGLEVTWFSKVTGDFTAQIARLKDKENSPGHFGSYVTEGMYYKFVLIDDSSQHKHPSLTWEIPEEGTDRFHRDGSTGAQFLLQWEPDSGFTFDLDS